MKIVDANIILRYLLDDSVELTSKAAAIIEGNELYLPFEVLAEVVYVFEKVYKIMRDELTKTLKDFIGLNNIKLYDKNIALSALDFMERLR